VFCGSAGCMRPEDDPLTVQTPVSRLPRLAATYVLILRLPRALTITIGRLGRFEFPAGWYCYAGSARGPGGLTARISRHRRATKVPHWHVDYLRAAAELVEIWYILGARKRECAWARAMANLPGASLPVPRFGASDCRCPAHLVHFSAAPDAAAFAHQVGEPISRERMDV
jgi:Uri superfamily endonuclease